MPDPGVNACSHHAARITTGIHFGESRQALESQAPVNVVTDPHQRRKVSRALCVVSLGPTDFSTGRSTFMDLGLNGRVAIVAASSEGLGRAVAMGLAREGARLALCARTRSTLESTAEEIRQATGAEVLAAPVDVTACDEVRRFVNQTRERFGQVDICVA